MLVDVNGGLGSGFRFGRTFRLVVGGDPVLPCFVWVEGAGEFAVGFVDFVVGGGGGFEAEEGVEGGVAAFVGGELVAESEDLDRVRVIGRRGFGSGIGGSMGAKHTSWSSFVNAQTRPMSGRSSRSTAARWKTLILFLPPPK